MTDKMPQKDTGKKEKQINHKRSFDMLKAFGLSTNESVIYIYMLERGAELGGSKIAFGTGIHRQYVYVSVNKLIELGLVEAIKFGKHKKYKAVAPGQLEKIARRRVVEAEDIIRELNSFSTIGHEQDFEVIQGEIAIQKFEIDRVKQSVNGTSQHFIGGGSEHFLDIMGDAYNEYAFLVKSKKISSQYIGSEHELSLANYYNNEQNMFDFRLLKKLPKSLVNVMITNDTVSFYTYAKPPILYIVKSKVVAKNYIHFFNMLWDMAEEQNK